MARILLIEDDNALRAVLCEALTHFGHTVIEARDGKEGLKLYPDSNVDLVITDILMPEKEGLEVVRVLRKKHPPARLIAMSGGGRGDAMSYLNVARLMGAAKVLEKPFSTKTLLAAISEVMPETGPR